MPKILFFPSVSQTSLVAESFTPSPVGETDSGVVSDVWDQVQVEFGFPCNTSDCKWTAETCIKLS